MTDERKVKEGASALGKRGGVSRSAAKRAAARQNLAKAREATRLRRLGLKP